MLRRDALELAEREARKCNLHNWRVVIDTRPTRRLGRCDHDRCEIGLTAWYVDLNDQADVLDTIRHELAHALAGHDAGHGREWRAWARALGCRPEARCPEDRIRRPRRRYAAHCPFCESKFSRDRRSQHRWYCPCTRRLSTRQPLKFTEAT